MGRRRRYGKLHDLRSTIGERRWVVVGDIHGYFDTFQALMGKVGLQDDDVLISCGDLVDRGPKVRETVEFFQNRPLTFCIEGNHENKAVRYFKGNPVEIAHGLETTVEAYAGREAEQEAFREWGAALPQLLQVPDINKLPTYVVHGGVDDKHPMERQFKDVCLYSRYVGGENFRDEENGHPWYEDLQGSVHVLFGHWGHPSPDVSPFAWALDGGVCDGRSLRALVNGSEFIEQERLEQ